MRAKNLSTLEVSRLPVLMAGILCMLMAGCSASSGDNRKIEVPAGSVVLAGAGSTFDSLLFKSWFTTYQHENPKTFITYDVVGSGEGVRRFIGKNVEDKEKVDFGASDAAMSDDEIALVRQGVLMLPITAGGVVLAYNLPGFEGELKLSRKAYAGIFLGEIMNWKDKLIAVSNPGVKLPTSLLLPSSGRTGVVRLMRLRITWPRSATSGAGSTARQRSSIGPGWRCARRETREWQAGLSNPWVRSVTSSTDLHRS